MLTCDTIPLRQEGERASGSELIGESPAMLRLRSVLDAICSRSCTVMIRGESGTGKELLARYLHARSARAKRPFVAVDCTTLKESLFESQLFGHAKGAFTGADESTLGFMRTADGGTLFLDEIGEMALPIQARLLRCIQDKAVVPLGGHKPVPVDIRFITATHRDLQAMVRRGEFREDLFFRLNVVQVLAPPLRQRGEDIRLLAEHFLRYFAELYREPVKLLSPEVIRALGDYSWPGNVRELANVMEQAHILGRPGQLELQDLPADLQNAASCGGRRSFIDEEIPTLRAAERTLLTKALTVTRGNQSQAAEILAIDRRRLRRKIRMHGLQSLLQR